MCAPSWGRRGLRWGARSGGRMSRGQQDREDVRPLFPMRKGWSASPGRAGRGGCCPALCWSVSASSWGGCRGSRLSGFANSYGVNAPGEADFLLQPAGRERRVRTREQAPAHPGLARLSVLCPRTGQPVAAGVTAPCTPAAGVPAPRGCSSQQGLLLPPLPVPQGRPLPWKARRGVAGAAEGLWVSLKQLHLHEL